MVGRVWGSRAVHIMVKREQRERGYRKRQDKIYSPFTKDTLQ
jgi:hypothetical protein